LYWVELEHASYGEQDSTKSRAAAGWGVRQQVKSSKIKDKIKFKGDGQECPSHTWVLGGE
jgi:hypothetical protein